ncbi:FDXHR family putative zinc-binding protein [Mobilicoccus massiliensis]|uniref:FDXHR family putative zinc-binding protein n=1 Tax=Mobilicoccus massiliensis TaxID=1522310 RepID=UPI00058B9C94
MTNIITHSCGSRWTDKRTAHCAACHRTFGGTRAFEMHRKNLTCADPRTMKGLAKTSDPVTGEHVWRRASPML